MRISYINYLLIRGVMYNRLWNNKGGITRTISVLMVIGLLLIMIAGSYIWARRNNEVTNNGTGPLIPPIAISIEFSNEGNITNNTGGWHLRIINPGENEWEEVRITLKNHTGSRLSTFNGIDQNTANYSYSTQTDNVDAPNMIWHIYSNGQPYFNNNGVRTKLNQTTFNGLKGDEFESLENVTMYIQDITPMGELNDRDYLSIFRDIDGDGTDDLSPGCSVHFTTSAGNLGGVSLN